MKKLNRNSMCHCGSGKKYKNCCMRLGQKNLSQNSTNTSDNSMDTDQKDEIYLKKT